MAAYRMVITTTGTIIVTSYVNCIVYIIILYECIELEKLH